MCMAIHDTIIERHICTLEWAVSNLLPSKEEGNPSGSSPSSSRAGGGVGGYAQKLIVIPEMAMGITPLTGSGITINI